MKTIAIGSFFVLFALVAGLSATAPAAFADHATASVSIPVVGASQECAATDECYVPYEVSVDVGGEVTWTNNDSVAHTVTSGTTADDEVGTAFDTGFPFEGGAEFTHTFEEAGTYDYFCQVHPWMAGVVVVQEAMDDEPSDGHTDDDGHMDGDMMDMEGDAAATGMLSDGTMVSVWTSEPAAGERMEINVVFEDSEHVNYDTRVTQNGETVLDDIGAHEHQGMGMHETAPLSSADPVDIAITFQGYGVEDPKTGPIGDEVVFSNVVPEFGTIAALILAAAIISIVAFSAKSRLSIIPRY